MGIKQTVANVFEKLLDESGRMVPGSLRARSSARPPVWASALDFEVLDQRRFNSAPLCREIAEVKLTHLSAVIMDARGILSLAVRRVPSEFPGSTSWALCYKSPFQARAQMRAADLQLTLAVIVLAAERAKFQEQSQD